MEFHRCKIPDKCDTCPNEISPGEPIVCLNGKWVCGACAPVPLILSNLAVTTVTATSV
jgi:hypothetical protein